ncbi:MAG: nucleoside phosphorylase [Desulfurococcales archaeon]|nr:nucleoside phosphorylase [Desulfurococcales archaeon]
MPIHIRAGPGDVAENVIIAGDPGRVEALAGLLEDARLVNTNRGLIAYTGSLEGVRVTLATHGMGGPSTAIVVEELHALGARRIVRLGTSGSLRGEVAPGSIIVATHSLWIPGTCGLSLYYDRVPPTPVSTPRLTLEIIEALREDGIDPHVGPVFCSDSFYAEKGPVIDEAAKWGALAVEMETATLYALSSLRGFESSALLVVSNSALDKSAYASPDTVGRLVRLGFQAIIRAFSRL